MEQQIFFIDFHDSYEFAFDDVNGFIESVNSILEPLRKENLKVWYSEKQINDITLFFRDLPDQSVFFERLNHELSDFGEPIKVQSNSEYETKRFENWELCDNSLNDFILHCYNKYSFYSKEFKSPIILFPSTNHSYKQREFITILVDKIRDNKSFEPQLHNLKYVDTAQKWFDYIKSESVYKEVNKNNKHGENGIGAHKSNKGKKVSKLYCSIQEAQILLDSAIRVKRINETCFFNFDPIRNLYIKFHYEGQNPQNQYHAYHIEKEDENNNNNLPYPIKKLLDERS